MPRLMRGQVLSVQAADFVVAARRSAQAARGSCCGACCRTALLRCWCWRRCSRVLWWWKPLVCLFSDSAPSLRHPIRRPARGGPCLFPHRLVDRHVSWPGDLLRGGRFESSRRRTARRYDHGSACDSLDITSRSTLAPCRRTCRWVDRNPRLGPCRAHLEHRVHERPWCIVRDLRCTSRPSPLACRGPVRVRRGPSACKHRGFVCSVSPTGIWLELNSAFRKLSGSPLSPLNPVMNSP